MAVGVKKLKAVKRQVTAARKCVMTAEKALKKHKDLCAKKEHILAAIVKRKASAKPRKKRVATKRKASGKKPKTAAKVKRTKRRKVAK
jgi:hypothetical protein